MTSGGDNVIQHEATRVNETIEYFRAKAPYYDEVDAQPYWVFSDELLWFHLDRLVLARMDRDDVAFLDAGGGTARWSARLLAHNASWRGTLVDLSTEMLGVAKKKAIAAGFVDRLEVHEADLQTWNAEGRRFDLVICFHNVLGFVTSPSESIARLSKLVAPGGFLVLVVPNYLHAIFYSIQNGRLDEVRRLRDTATVKFTDGMPAIHTFKAEWLLRELSRTGLQEPLVLGFPVSMYPEAQETSIRDSSDRYRVLLTDPDVQRELMTLERVLSSDPTAATRGNNLLAVGYQEKSVAVNPSAVAGEG